MLLKKIICVFSVLLVFFCNNVFAATKEDVITAINKTYTVGNETFRLPQKIITKGENYLKKNKLSSTQYDNILRCIDNAVALAREVGTTDIKKVSKEDLKRALQILTEASASANVDLNKELAENDINISEIVNQPPVVESETPPVIEPETPDLPVTNEQVNAETNNNETTIDNAQKNDDKNIISNVGQIDNNTQTNSDINNSNETVPDNVPTENNSNVPTVGNTQNSTQNVNKQGDINIEKLLTIAIAVLIFVLFVFILIFYLLFKSNWNKILKYMLMIIFVILIILVLVVLVGLFYYMEEIKLVYKLYYMFN
ncbi:MAG: hypothetical protein J6B87_04395 [Clostridia bacterium]|nr:hypothetical protein [Clostridia bacterium]